MIRSLKDLEVYVKSFDLAMEVFKLAETLPKSEQYSLTLQIIRSSRSVSANISEGWAKRKYESVFKKHLIHSLGSVSETQTWLDFALECKYINKDIHEEKTKKLNEIGRMLTQLHNKWKTHPTSNL